MNILTATLIVIFVISAIAWLFNWSQACSFLKEPKALSFYFWPNVFFSEKFKPEGNKYRKKALVFLLLQAIPLIIMLIFSGK